MYTTIAIAICLLLFNSLCYFFYLPPMIIEGMSEYLLSAFGIAVAIFTITTIAYLLLQKSKHKDLTGHHQNVTRPFQDRGFLIFTGNFVLVLFVLKRIAVFSGSVTLYVILFCIAFFLAGALLSKRYKDASLPFLLGLMSVIILSTIESIVFVLNPSVRALFGPETIIFAIRDFVGDSSMFPLCVAIVWSGWCFRRVVTD